MPERRRIHPISRSMAYSQRTKPASAGAAGALRAGPRQTVLITDGDERAALAAARSLIAAGYEVFVAARGRRSLGGVTRGAQSLIVRSDPLSDSMGYALEMASHAERIRACMVLPITDASVETLLQFRALPPSTAVPFAGLSTCMTWRATRCA